MEASQFVSMLIYLTIILGYLPIQVISDNQCEVGPTVMNRVAVDSGTQFAAVMPTFTFDCDGPIVEWKFFTFNLNPIKGIVFAQDTSPGAAATDWIVHGYNDITITQGERFYLVPENDRFDVVPGLAIGFAGSNVKYSRDGDNAYLNSFSSMGTSVTVGNSYEMRWPNANPRTYSIAAIVEKPQISFHFTTVTVCEGDTLYVNVTNVGSYTHTISLEMMNGTAISGEDYEEHIESYTLDGGEQATFEVATIADHICETEAKNLTLMLFYNDSFTQIDYTENYTMTVVIDSDTVCEPPLVNFKVEEITLCEGDSTSITLINDGACSHNVSVTTVNQTADSWEDFENRTEKYNLLSGESGTFVINTASDTICETDTEHFTVELLDEYGKLLTDNTNATISVEIPPDTECEPPIFNFAEVEVGPYCEGETFTVMITNDGYCNHTVSVSTKDGTAVINEDFENRTEIYTLQGQESANFTNVILNGTCGEYEEEDFVLELYDENNVQITDTMTSTTTVKISPDDACGNNTTPYFPVKPTIVQTWFGGFDMNLDLPINDTVITWDMRLTFRRRVFSLLIEGCTADTMLLKTQSRRRNGGQSSLHLVTPHPSMATYCPGDVLSLKMTGQTWKGKNPEIDLKKGMKAEMRFVLYEN